MTRRRAPLGRGSQSRGCPYRNQQSLPSLIVVVGLPQVSSAILDQIAGIVAQEDLPVGEFVADLCEFLDRKIQWVEDGCECLSQVFPWKDTVKAARNGYG